MPEEVAILAAALAFDLVLGEYPSRLHPVVWMGWVADRLLRFAPQQGALGQCAFGVLVLVAVTIPFAVPTWLLLDTLQWTGGAVYVLAGALVLKPSFALRALWTEVEGVRAAVDKSDLTDARLRVGRIVSRDVAILTPGLIASAAVESAAESLTDSFVAPLFYFVLLGPAAALAYRAVNTLDAMIGYHGTYEYLGKAAALVDDALNLVPARIASLLLAVSSGPAGGSVAGALRGIWRDRARTESPNAGWTMSAMGGALGVRLEKPGSYVLGSESTEPLPSHIKQALIIVAGAAVLCTVIAVVVLVWRYGGLT